MEKAPEQHWYVVYTKRQREDMAQAHLKRKGFDTFFPRLRLPYGQREQRHIVPLFPNYLFARLRLPDDYNVVRWSPGVNRMVGYGGNPTPLEETIVEFLRQKCTPEGILPARVGLAGGSEVRIVSGPFKGLLGIIENPPDVKGRVQVLMQLLSRQVRVEVPVEVVTER